jgi:hypothetical protein
MADTIIQTDDGQFIELKGQPSQNQTPIDFERIRALAGSDDGDCIWDPELNLAENFKHLITSCIELYEPDKQLPLLTAFALLPSTLIQIAPIAICHGQPGSGKSVMGSLIAKLHNVNVLSANSTYAAIRNALNQARWQDDDFRFELNTCLVFDDCKESSFDDDLFTLFRCGYSRDTERIQISSQTPGVNMTFYSFSPKLFSTTSLFPFKPAFEELMRRSFVFTFKRSAVEREYLEPCDVDFGPYRAAFKARWENLDNSAEMMDFLKFIKSLRRPKSIDSNKWLISKPMIASLVFNEIVETKSEAIELITTYWIEFTKPKSALTQLLEREIAQAEALIESMQANSPVLIPFELSCESLNKAIQYAKAVGALDTVPNQQLIVEEMAALGFTIDHSNRKYPVWTKIQ